MATVAILPFASPPSDLALHNSGTPIVLPDSQIELWFMGLIPVPGNVDSYRLAYAVSWSLCLGFNISVVFMCTMLYLALPHLTQVSARLCISFAALTQCYVQGQSLNCMADLRESCMHCRMLQKSTGAVYAMLLPLPSQCSCWACFSS
jgi:hypothetical protein